jgi:iron complex outermembrane recepter protein
MVYARVAEGYKAGGFNSEGPVEYGTEHTWNYELGHKALWLDGKLETTAAAAYPASGARHLSQENRASF